MGFWDFLKSLFTNQPTEERPTLPPPDFDKPPAFYTTPELDSAIQWVTDRLSTLEFLITRQRARGFWIGHEAGGMDPSLQAETMQDAGYLLAEHSYLSQYLEKLIRERNRRLG